VDKEETGAWRVDKEKTGARRVDKEETGAWRADKEETGWRQGRVAGLSWLYTAAMRQLRGWSVLGELRLSLSKSSFMGSLSKAPTALTMDIHFVLAGAQLSNGSPGKGGISRS